MDELLKAMNEVSDTIYQLPLSDLIRLVKAFENTTTLAEVAPEYLRLRDEEDRPESE